MIRRRRCLGTLVVALLAAAHARGATITADGTTCTLTDAILSTEGNTDTGGCTGVDPYGADTILLDYDVTLTAADTLNSVEYLGLYAGLPDVTSDLTIEGRAGRVIQRDPALGCEPEDADAFRLFYVFSATADLTLDGIELRNGCAAPAQFASRASGGAIAVVSGALTLVDSVLEGNRSIASTGTFPADGGAIYLLGAGGTATFHFERTRFVDNAVLHAAGSSGSGMGGAVYADSSTTGAVLASEFVGNRAFGGDFGGFARGGAIAFGVGSTELTEISDSIFRDNSVQAGEYFSFFGEPTAELGGFTGGPASGGAIGFVGVAGQITNLTRTIFENNRAIGGAGSEGGGQAVGGALECSDSCYLPSASDLLFRGNGAFGGAAAGSGIGGNAIGGAVFVSDIDAWDSLTFEGNEARGGSSLATGGAARGGALASQSFLGDVFANLTAFGNVAQGGDSVAEGAAGEARGGALYLPNGVTLRSASLSGNRAVQGAAPGSPTAAAGGGLWGDDDDLVLEYVAAAGNVVVDSSGAETANDCDQGTLAPTSGGANVILAAGTCADDLTEPNDAPGTDPQLGPLGGYGCIESLPDGACLPTMPLDLTSAAIDRGDCTGLGFRDARGFNRAIFLSGGKDPCDAGASEQQHVIYVDASATGADDGSSWTDACVSLRDALDLSCIPSSLHRPASAGASLGTGVGSTQTEFWIAQGVYRPDVGTAATPDDPVETFPLGSSGLLFGGFAGGETSLAERDPAANPTVLSGDIDENDTVDGDGVTPRWSDLAGANAYHLITADLEGSSGGLDGLVLSAGQANGVASDDRRGAAVLCISGGTLQLRDVRVVGNWTASRAALYPCQVEASDASFEGNGTGDIGTIVAGLDARFVRSRFVDNFALLQANLAGQGTDSLRLIDSTIRGHASQDFVGAIASQGLVELTNVVVSGLGATSIDPGSALLELGAEGDATLTNVTVSGNDNFGGEGTIHLLGTGRLRIRNSILWNNRLDGVTGSLGASITDTGNATVEIRHSILQGSGGSGAWTAPWIDGGGNLDVDPEFASPVDPATAPTAAGDLRLRYGSPAVDAGDDTLVTALTDLVGAARIQGPAVDLGPWEDDGTIFVDGFESGNTGAWSAAVD